MGKGPRTEHLTNIRENIGRTLSLDDLKTLAFDLGVDLDDFPGGKNAKIREMLRHLAQQERIPALIQRLQALRPVEPWGNMLPDEPEARSPYKGLQYFSEDDERLFFGREALTKQLVEKLRQERFVVVVGASGSGKSSLVRAGLVPALRRGEVQGSGLNSAVWPIHIITPGDQPLKTLAVSLTRDSESVTAAATLTADLKKESSSLDLFLMRQMSNQQDGRILLVVDQFEELFTLCGDKKVRQQFIDNLVNAVRSGQPGRLSLVLTLRADFYTYAVQYEALRPLLETGQQIIGAMSRKELGEVILKPAVTEGWRFESGLIEHILDEVSSEPGVLPLLSHALQETWLRREGRLMTLAGYVRAGGVGGAIAKTADNVYNDLSEEQQTLAKIIFLRLTELGEGREDTRRRVWQTELVRRPEEQETVIALLQRLAAARLISTSTQNEQDGPVREVVEVSHEALIREWPTLQGWLDENREWLRLQRQLTEAAEIWETNQREESYLYHGNRLTQMAEWATNYDDQLNPLERAFIEAGVAQKLLEDNAREKQRQAELAQAQTLATTAQAQAWAERRAARRTRLLFMVLLALVVLVGVILQQPIRRAILRQQALGPALVEIPASNGVPLGLKPEEMLEPLEALPERLYDIPAFKIEPYEVTNDRYNLCVRAGVCTRPRGLPSEYERENFPVVNVSALQAADFCQWIGRELPNELQWERAARYNDGRLWPWGNEPGNRDPAYAHFNLGPTRDTAQEVGLLVDGRSEEGAYDLAGNVWEWTRSYYEIESGEWSGLPNEPTESLVIRGGGFVGRIRNIMVRTESDSTDQLNYIGIRCVES